jgi:hypothetical protein
MSIESMKLALEVLQKSLPRLAPYGEQDWLDSKAAIKALEEALAKQDTNQPVAFKIYLPKVPRQDVNHGLLPWVYDQDPSSGNVASMWVTPVQTLRSKS